MQVSNHKIFATLKFFLIKQERSLYVTIFCVAGVRVHTLVDRKNHVL